MFKKNLQTNYHPTDKRGFTLIELLLVIGVIGILTAVILIGVNPAQRIAETRDAIRKSDLTLIAKGLEIYYIKNGVYPLANMSDWSFVRGACPTRPWGWNTCETTNDLRTALVPNYMKELPVDPVNKDYASINNRGYHYFANFSGSGYVLCTHLENASDPDTNNTPNLNNCDSYDFANYYIIK